MSFFQQAFAPSNADRRALLLHGVGDILKGGNAKGALSQAMMMGSPQVGPEKATPEEAAQPKAKPRISPDRARMILASPNVPAEVKRRIAETLTGGSGGDLLGGDGNDQLMPQDPAVPLPGVGVVPYSQIGGSSGRIGAPRTGGTDEPPVSTYRFPEFGGAMTGAGGADSLGGGEANDALPYGDAKLNENQSKSIIYYRRGYGANNALNDPKLESALTEFDDRFAGNFGSLGRWYQSEDYQVADRAAREFLAAILRKDTGAAITSQEFDLYGPMYLPLPGDKPAVLSAKKKAREEALTAIEMGLGTAAPLAGMVRDELAPQQAPDLGAMSDDDLMKMLTGGS